MFDFVVLCIDLWLQDINCETSLLMPITLIFLSIACSVYIPAYATRTGS